MRQADTVLTRSVKASEILLARAGAGTKEDKFNVVSNGRDIELFNPGSSETRSGMREALGVSTDAPLLVYAGSIGPQYCATEMLRLFELIKKRGQILISWY